MRPWRRWKASTTPRQFAGRSATKQRRPGGSQRGRERRRCSLLFDILQVENLVTVMIFTTPPPSDREQQVLEEIASLQLRLARHVREPRRWIGSLRRAAMARAIQGSNSIEGYDAALDDAAAVDLGEEPLDADEETRLALRGYRDAMTYVLQLTDDDEFTYTDRLLKSLHFMMTSYELAARPGLWRSGPIYVRDDARGKVVYEGPEVELVPQLVRELTAELNATSQEPAVVTAAMAHLNLVMIHPFRDGNGRMARCLQTLVLARGGLVAPVFSSIEEYLGRNTQAYYDALAAVGAGRWQPDRDARPWVQFILTAHVRQARTMVRRVGESERLWEELDRLATRHGLAERTEYALYDALLGYRVRNATYRAVASLEGQELTEATALRDLRQLTEAGLLVARGEKRGRVYVAGEALLVIRRQITAARDPRDDVDPFTAGTVQAEGRLF